MIRIVLQATAVSWQCSAALEGEARSLRSRTSQECHIARFPQQYALRQRKYKTSPINLLYPALWKRELLASARRKIWTIRVSLIGFCGLLLIASLFVTGTSKRMTSATVNKSVSLVTANTGPARTQQVAHTIARLRVVNYYPASNGWTKMWTNWQPAVLDRDFARIRALGANAVRVVVFPNTFGWPTVSLTMASRFADMLAIAASKGLGVQVTLFDWWASYNEVAQSRMWLRSLLHTYSSDPEIQFVELKNEVDPSNSSEVEWLRALLPSLRSILPRTPITVSVSGIDDPSRFACLRSELDGAPLDVADIHFYGSEEAAYRWMVAAKRAAGSLPLFIGEIGCPVEGSAGGSEAAELSQAHWYDVVLSAARTANLSSTAPLTLNTFQTSALPGRPA